MPVTYSGASGAVATLNRTLQNTSQSKAAFDAQLTAAAAALPTGADAAVALNYGAYADSLAASLPAKTAAEWSNAILTNMGVLPSTVAAVQELEAALTGYINANGGVARIGTIALQLGAVIGSLETATGNQAVYNAAAVAWNTEVSNSVSYSSNVLSTAATTDNIPAPIPPVQNLTLTTGVDKGAAFTGTAGVDVYTGVVSSLSTEGTLNATDELDGGAGLDTLNVDLKAGFTGFTGTGGVKNVETISLSNASSIDRVVSTKGIVDATTYNLNATGAAISLSDLVAAGGTVNVANQTKGAVTLGFAAAAVAGTADALTLGLNKVGTVEVKSAAGAVTTAEAAVAVTAAGIETLTVNATGANVAALAGVADAKSIVVTGDGALKVNSVGAAVTSFDASAATGKVVADLTGATVSTLTAVKGGAGDDAFTVDAADLTSNATLQGGAGANTLTFNGAGNVLQPTMSGFQTLGLKAVSAPLTISGKNAVDLNTVSLEANALAGNGLTIANLTAPTFTLKTNGLQNAATVILTSASDLTYSTSALAATLTTKTAADVVAINANATEAKSMTIDVGAYTTVGGTFNVTKATAVTVNVASGQNASKAELTAFTGTVNAGKATQATVAASGLLTAATLNVGEAQTATLTANAGGSAVLNANKAVNATIATGGTGFVLTGNLDGAEQASLTATKGNLNATGIALGKVNALTLAGADATSQIGIGALGSAAQNYALTVNASGLKGGLAIGTVSSASDVSLSLGSVTGAVTQTGAIVGKTVTINADGATGAIALAAAAAAAAAITADVVTVNAAGALSTFVVGNGATAGADIIAKNAVTYNGTDLSANGLNVLAGVDSTALTAVLNGGIANDTYTVTGTTTTTSLTVSGALSIGTTDSVTVDATAATAATARTVTIDLSGVTSSATTATTIINGATGANLKNTITGSALADTIIGGLGADTLTGGAGADKFVIATTAATAATDADVITDFVTGSDTITIAGATTAPALTKAVAAVADFAAALAAANTVLATTGTTTAPTANAQQVGADTWVFISNNAAAGAEHIVKLTGVALAGVVAGDFVIA